MGISEKSTIPASSSPNEWYFIAVLAIAWSAMVGLANPVGNFPLNDDWAHGAAVRAMRETGKLIIPDWTATNFIGQLYWGLLFCLPFGFSYTALRFSSLTLGLLGVVASYMLLREIRVSPKHALMLALVVATNPIYFALSNTFMTDVPFFAWTSVALLCYLRYLRTRQAADIVWGTLFAILSLLIRQTGIVLPFAFGGVCYLLYGRGWRSLVAASIPFMVAVAVQFLYQRWLMASGQMPTYYGVQIWQIIDNFSLGPGKMLGLYGRNFFDCAMYLALFLLPVLALYFHKFVYSLGVGRCLLGVVVFGLAWGCLRFAGVKGMPRMDNIIIGSGIGPLLQVGCGGYSAMLGKIKALDWFWLALEGALVPGILAMAWFAVGAVSRIRHHLADCINNGTFLFVLYAGFLIVSIMAVTQPFDRYVLVPLLAVLLAVVSVANVDQPAVSAAGLYSHVAMALVLLLGYGALTTLTTHDYLAWNRTRWQALDSLMQEDKIPPSQIDGGFEFNGAYLYSSGQRPENGRWWVVEDRFLIAFTPIDGFTVKKSFPVDSWLPVSPSQIFVLEKNYSG